MKKQNASNIFETFNARALNPFQVAETFVPPSHYDKLIKPIHSVVVGPRGSGKTTLLKMLQSPALESWKHPKAGNYREKIDFTGIFIPTDISWSEQLKALGESKLSFAHQKLLSVSAFSTQVLRALVDSIEYRSHPPKNIPLFPHRRISIDKEQETLLVKEVADKWFLDITLPSFLSLKYALTDRLSQIKRISSQEAYLSEESREERLAAFPFLNLNFLSAGTTLIERFNDIVGEPYGKWALLFDELELAPNLIRDELISALRSVDERWLFKLSISPYGENVHFLENTKSAMPGNDYEPIPLWYAHKEDGYDFCEDLFQSILQKKGISLANPTEILGKSEFETWHEGQGKNRSYQIGSRIHNRLVRMYENDRTFRKYIDEKKIDIDKIYLMPAEERAATIRKIVPLLAVREAFRSPDEATDRSSYNIRTRSRKNPKLYSGATSLFAIVEGNPRWFIAIVGNLLNDYKKGKEIPPSKQGNEIIKSVNRFRALLKTIPCPTIKRGRRPRGVLTILDSIGDFIYNNVVRYDFEPEPVGSFTVDSHVSDELIESLGRALNAGAIVYVPDEDSHFVLGSLKGKRFRLSYILAPHYGIPIRLGRSISLTHILDRKRDQPLFKEMR